MIVSLADAWHWYESVRDTSLTMRRIAVKHWQALPLTELARDERLKNFESSTIENRSLAILSDLDDLCVLLLFSVFEAHVRELALEQIDLELPVIRHPGIKHAIYNLRESIESGSFFRVLEPYKAAHASLVEEVNQVRRYRNWVAHGRRGEQPAVVTPYAAYDRLQRFMLALDAS